jgi:serine/threonine-protein kinase
VQRGALSLTSVGRYGLRKVLGSGPSGTVYVGYDPEDGRDVAVNLMAAVEPSFEDVARTCVADEAEAWGQLGHPHIVEVHDVGYYRDPKTGRSGVYVVRELVGGMDLQRWLEGRPQFSGTKAWLPILELFLPIGLALGAAHRAKLVHRRFSPASVVVSYDAEVKLLDFGTFHATPLSPNSVVPEHYPAPELARGAPADARADQYSYCASLKAALDRATDGRIPSGLDKVLERGMASDPAARWPSMEELVRQLIRRRPWWKRPLSGKFTAAAAATMTLAIVLGLAA